MVVLSVNVVLANPETGEPVVLEAGSEIPDWAAAAIGDHAIEADESERPAPKRARA